MYAPDPLDLRILEVLQTNGRMPARQIATKIFRSPQTVHNRIDKLQQEGYIGQYIALLDRRKCGMPALVVTLVKLEKQNRANLAGFGEQARSMPQVQCCLQVSGKWDFVLFVSVRDPQAYYDWLMNELGGLDNIEHVESSFSLKEWKTYGPLQLDRITGAPG